MVKTKMVKTSDFNSEVYTGTVIYVLIDDFRFLFDEDGCYVTVEIDIQGTFEFLQDIDLEDEVIVNHDDLKRVALNWIFQNVELVKDLGQA